MIYKIPYIKRIITILSVIYGRTTIWKVLVRLRKLFIIFNAVIGVYMVFKTVGFGYDNLLAGFVGMGHSYIEIFSNFTKKLFHWFVELFDHKIVPNVPGDNLSNSGNVYRKIWSNGPIDKSAFNPQNLITNNVEDSLRKSYKSLFNISVEPTPTSWYKDLSTWIWIGGIIAGGAIIVGGVYCVYSFIQDPSILFGDTTVDKGKGVAPAVVISEASSEGSITPTVESSIALKITKKLVKTIFKPFKYLNPNYWLTLTPEQATDYEAFQATQRTVQYSSAYYPFTKINPYDSWINRLRIQILGETTSECLNRKMLRNEILASLIPVAESSTSGSTLTVTPQIASVGLGITGIDTGFQQTVEKLFSVPNTPGLKPITHLMSESVGNPFEQDILNSAAGRLKNLPLFDEDLSTPNKFAVLEVE